MAPTTGTMSTPRSRRAIPMRSWSSHHARARCRVRRPWLEADVSRWKRVIGDGLRSQTDGRQATEIAIAADALNRMLDLGRPEYVRIAWPATRVGLSAPDPPTHTTH